MIAALSTLLFLVTILALVAIAALILEESGTKILAALRGQSPLAKAPVLPAVRVRLSQRVRWQRPVRAEARWRAAA